MAAPRIRLKPGLLGVASLAGLLLAIDTGAWFWTTGRMAQDLDAWQAAQRDLGLNIRHAPPVRTGWPFAARLLLRQTIIETASPQEAGTFSWQADLVTLSLSPLHPAALLIIPSGSQRLTSPGVAPLPITAARLAIHIPLSGAPGSAEAQGIRVGLPTGPLTAVAAEMQFDAAHVTLSAQDVGLPLPDLPFGGVIASASVRAATTVVPAPAADLQTSAAAWRDAGGRLLLDGAAIHWGPLQATGSATLTLDSALQPQGTVALHLTGYAELIEALTRAGTISRNDARVAATLLGLMAHASPAGPPSVDLPLTIQDGRLSAGAIPLARLPRLSLP